MNIPLDNQPPHRFAWTQAKDRLFSQCNHWAKTAAEAGLIPEPDRSRWYRVEHVGRLAAVRIRARLNENTHPCDGINAEVFGPFPSRENPSPNVFVTKAAVREVIEDLYH